MTAFALCLLLAGPLLAEWEPDFRMTYSQPGLEPQTFANRWLAASNGVVHVVWGDGRGVSGDVFYKRSPDGGATWDADFDVVEDSEYSQQCAVAAHGQNVHMVWDGNRDENEEIYIRSSADGGSSWSGTTRLTVDDAISKLPTVACWGEHIHVAWWDGRSPGGGSIYFKTSSDNGASWTGDALLTDPVDGGAVALAVDDSMVHAVWADFREMGFRIYYKRSFDHGATWTADAPLSAETGMFPSISVSGMDVHAAWQDYAGETWYRGSTDGGETWSGDQLLTVQDGYSSDLPSVFSSGPLVHLVWAENSYDQSGPELAYRLSRDHGTTWGGELRLTTAEHFSNLPQLAADGDGLHVSWWDARDTFPEIYYKRNPDGNVPGVAEGRSARPGAWASLLRPNPVLSYARVPGHEAEPFVVLDAAGRPVQECSGDRVGAGLPAGVYLLRSANGGLGPVRFVKLQ